MSNTIKAAGNIERFSDQKTARLLSAEIQLVCRVSPKLRDHVGGELPRGTAIKTVFDGDQGIPFVDLRNYGSATLARLQSQIGQTFEIVYSLPADSEQVEAAIE